MKTRTVYSSKKSVSLAEPVHGRCGWSLDENGVLEELVYVRDQGWLRVGEYRAGKDKAKIENIKFYENHPALLQMKIRDKKRSKRASGLNFGFSRAWSW